MIPFPALILISYLHQTMCARTLMMYSNRFYAISLKQIPILMMHSNRFYTYNIFKADTYTNDVLQSFLSNFFRADTYTNEVLQLFPYLQYLYSRYLY